MGRQRDQLEDVEQCLPVADCLLVGNSAKSGPNTTLPVDAGKLARYMDAVAQAQAAS